MKDNDRLEKRILSNLFPALLNMIKDCIYIIDRNGHFVFINHAVEEMEGLKNKEIHGKHINDIYVQDYSPSLNVLSTGRTITNYENEYYVNGKKFIQDCCTFPIKEGEEIIGVASIHKDITPLKDLVSENILLQSKTTASDTADDAFERIIGENEEFKKAVHIARIAAGNNSAVLLTGPTGSGKEVFARAIHETGSRRDKPFLAVNCAAIPESLLEGILFGTSKGSFTGAMNRQGLFEQANGGTLFLDEINSMPLASQAKLLRVLETKEIRHIGGQEDIKVDVRIISSCNLSSHEAISSNRLREDLFYRLAVVNVIIPGLALRRSDIPILADYFIKMYNQQLKKNILSFDKDVSEAFMRYEWPGNVRQLKHCIEYAVTIASPADRIITMSRLPQYFTDDLNNTSRRGTHKTSIAQSAEAIPAAPHETAAFSNTDNLFEEIENVEIENIVNALVDCNGNVTQAAKKLNMHRQSLIYRMKKYNIMKK